MAYRNFRTEINDGIYTVLAGVNAAHSDLLPVYSRQRPAKFTDFPLAYIEGNPETVLHDVGTRTRLMSPSIVLVDRIADNAETEARLDQLLDTMLAALSASPQLATGTIWSRATVSDETAEMGDYLFAAVRITLQNISIQEGGD